MASRVKRLNNSKEACYNVILYRAFKEFHVAKAQDTRKLMVRDETEKGRMQPMEGRSKTSMPCQMLNEKPLKGI